MKTSFAVAAFVSLAGCASTGTGMTGRVALISRGSGATFPAMAGEHDDQVRRTFPARRSEATLPQVDRLAHRIRAEYAGTISADVRLCLRPDGKPDYVNLTTTSGMIPFDLAVVESISSWEFVPFAAPAAIRVCEDLTVVYHAK